MLTYESIRGNRRTLLALTGLTASEFDLLLDPFVQAGRQRRPPDRTAAGRRRRRAVGAGRRPVLRGAADRLLFILVYVKAYPLQAVMARLFAVSQPTANPWVHRPLPPLRDALAALGARPERDPARFAAAGTAAPAAGSAPSPRPRPRRLIVDGTDRRRQRPKKPLDQALHCSGKRKAHCGRNVLVADAGRQRQRPRVGYLRQTYPCRAHEKAIAAHEAIAYPPGTTLYADGGFGGYDAPTGAAAVRRPKKSRRAARSRPRSVAPTARCRASAWPSSTRPPASSAAGSPRTCCATPSPASPTRPSRRPPAFTTCASASGSGG